MIVRDNGDAWQIVLQTDHAVLAGDFARAWGNGSFEQPRPLGTVLTATRRHDDGWAIWERAPSLLSRNGTTKPRNFLDVQVQSHLAFYRGMIAAVLDDDPYAGLLVSMHGAGIYNGRYGTQPSLRLTFAAAEQGQVESFVREQEETQRRLIGALGVADEERWVNYKLLQIFDRLSLYFAMKDLDGGEADTVAPVPVGYGGEETELRIEPTGPWAVRVAPYPFREPEATFTMLRRVLPKRQWRDADEFRDDFFSKPPDVTTIAVSGG